MNVLREATKGEIEAHLEEIGRRNHDDNMRQVNRYCDYHFVELTKEEFFSLVFPDMSSSTRKLIEKAQNRRLDKVATEAIKYDEKKLGTNWDLNEIAVRTNACKNDGAIVLTPLFILPARNEEKDHGDWYLQDGAHRALGYAVSLIIEGISYVPVKAYRMS